MTGFTRKGERDVLGGVVGDGQTRLGNTYATTELGAVSRRYSVSSLAGVSGARVEALARRAKEARVALS